MGRNVGVGTSVRGYKKEKKSPVAGIIWGFILIIIAIVCVALFTPIFNIDTITVTGNEHVDAGFITESSGILTDTNLFRVNVGAAEKNIAGIAYINSVKVSRRLPKTIEISVTECKVAGLIPFVSGYIAVDKLGKVLEAVNDKALYSAPTLAGASISACELGKQVKFTESDKLDIFLACLKEFDSVGLLDGITAIDLTDIYEIQVIMNNSLYINYGGMTDFPYKTQMLSKVLGNIPNPPKGYIDLRAGNNVFYKENYSEEGRIISEN